MPITLPFLAQFARTPQKPHQSNTKSKDGQTVPNLPPPSTRLTEVRGGTTDDE